MNDDRGVYARAQEIVVELTGMPCYMAPDEDWYVAVEMAREELGIHPQYETAPICQQCGDVAPYGDERILWLNHHNSGFHRWWQKMKRKFRRG